MSGALDQGVTLGNREPDRRWFVRYLMTVALVLGLAFPGYLAFFGRGTPPEGDFDQFWAAARLNLAGRNPYDQVQLFAVPGLRSTAHSDAFAFRNPPATLPLVTPFALFSLPLARAAFYLLGLGIILLGVVWLWRHYGGPSSGWLLAAAISLVFVPDIGNLGWGQVSVFSLLGIIGFLHFTRREQWWSAGLMLSLATVKPHLVILLWLALLLWAVKNRTWSVLLGLAAGTLMLSCLAMLTNPTVVSQFVWQSARSAATDWATPTLGAALRFLFGWSNSWLQYLPTAAGAGWLVFSWRGRAGVWDWSREVPLLLLVSLLTMPYGWYHDGILALPAIIAGFVAVIKSGSRIVPILFEATFLAINAAALPITNGFWHVWLFPVLLAWYLLAVHCPAVAGDEPRRAWWRAGRARTNSTPSSSAPT